MHIDGNIVFCTGGCRSGKSAYALNLVSGLTCKKGQADSAGQSAPKVFVATMEARDAESRERVRRHQEERMQGDASEWQTLEIPIAQALNLPEKLDEACALGGAVLLDCLSTWVSACLEAVRINVPGLEYSQTEDMIAEVFAAALLRLRKSGLPVVIVSCEVGLGLVPADRESRLFRDALGRVNQLAAAAADEVVVLLSGLPLRLK
ncbi:bifunctional adenosylcobinamide kinase/adenosylcobinamide-phosphate guanylyltransferase [Desulfovibrio sp. OttesenSCG-928-C06]|nr:bifunctional adenosylcobinamide kinase/adenosylcobinamide-phosphate guanylyltransferase [Desulfovibrio sp. OttesenSCG-928-C06]